MIPKGINGAFHPSKDGRLWLFERRWEPPKAPKATLMIVHGTVDHSGVYAELAAALTAVGVAVFASDMRGWGLSDGEALYFHDLDTFVEDVKADYWRIHTEERYKNVAHRFLLGKSIGGLVTAFVASRYPDLFSGLIGLSGAYEIASMLPPAPVMWALNSVVWLSPKLPLKPVFRPELIVSDAAALDEWRRDELAAKGKVTVAYITTAAEAASILPGNIPLIIRPLLLLWGTGDQVVSLAGHQMMLDRASSRDKTLKTYEKGFHNLLAEPRLKNDVIRDIKDWILNHC